MKTNGWTLIEMLVTVSILGILIALATPAYINYTNKARVTEAINEASNIKTQLALLILGGEDPGDVNIAKGGTSFGITLRDNFEVIESSIYIENAGSIEDANFKFELTFYNNGTYLWKCMPTDNSDESLLPANCKN
jgi:type IV pilus assembly protein PilA